MDDYLLFRLYGPLASWGDTAVGEYRPSYHHPSRSAVLGMLAAALGICRDEEERLLALDRDYRIAVRVERGGELLRDYHTVQSPPEAAIQGLWVKSRRDEIKALEAYWAKRGKPPQASPVSQRDYRTDAAYSIAVQAARPEAHRDLAPLAQALRRPGFPLYLGRKSCPPALPLDARVVQAHGLRDAFEHYPSCLAQLGVLLADSDYMAYHTGRMLAAQSTAYYWEEGFDCTGLEAQMIYPRRDRLRSRRRWQFDTRDEYHATTQEEQEGA